MGQTVVHGQSKISLFMIDLTSHATRSASASLLLLICTDHSLVKYLADAVATNIPNKQKDVPGNITILYVAPAGYVIYGSV